MNKGELSPRLHSRVDVDAYKAGLKVSKNGLVVVQGGNQKRSGTSYAANSVQDQTMDPVRNIEFIFSKYQAYVLEMGDRVIRLFTAGAPVMNGGTPYEITTPYLQSEIWQVDFVQAGDVMYMVHNNHPIQKLSRFSELNWTMEDVDLQDGPYLNLHRGNNSLITSWTGKPGYTPTASQNSGSADNAWNSERYNNWNSDNPSNQWIQIQFTSSASYACNGLKITAYYITGSEIRTVNTFRVRGLTPGTSTLYSAFGELGWQTGEERSYTFNNTEIFNAYRIYLDTNNGGQDFQIANISLSLKNMWQRLTWNNTDGINDGAGFTNDDIGRYVRWLGDDGEWRVLEILTVNSTVQVEGFMTGFWFEDSANRSSTWQLGAISKTTGYPSAIAIFQERLALAGTIANPRTVYLSQTGDYEDFSLNEPIADDDAMTVTLAGGTRDPIYWLRETYDQLMIGMADGIKSLGGTNNEPLSPTNRVIRNQTYYGASDVRPLSIGRTLFYVGFHGKEIHELAYSEAANSFDAPVITTLNEHLFKSGIVQMARLQDPDNAFIAVCNDGSAAYITYEQAQQVLGAVPIEVGGVDVKVLSVAAIPESGRDYFYLEVERTINSQTRRYQERLEAVFEYQDEQDSWFLDSGILYEGAETNVITGLDHLEGETVKVLGWNDATGMDYPTETGLTVTNGTINLQYEVTKAVIGLPYEYAIQLLSFATMQSDGSSFARDCRVNEVLIDFWKSRSVNVRSGNRNPDELIKRKSGDAMDAYPPLFTGTKRVPITDSWREKGEIELFSNEPHPSFIRSITLSVESEP